MSIPVKLKKITEEFLKNETSEFDLETIYTLSLSFHGIFDLGCIGSCVNLISLDLSRNNLSSVMTLRTLTLLEMLNLSENRLSALSGVEQLLSLEVLNVSGNLLSSLDALLPLTKPKNLSTFTLTNGITKVSNPVVDTFDDKCELREKIKTMLPNLTCIDGIIVTGEGEKFNKLCENGISKSNFKDFKKYLNSVNIPKNQHIPEPPFVKIGFEENETYNRGKDLSDECIDIAQKASRLLEQMKDDYRS